MGGWFYDTTSEIVGWALGLTIFAVWVLWRLRVFVLLLGAVIVIGEALSGCAPAKTIFDACRDGNCR